MYYMLNNVLIYFCISLHHTKFNGDKKISITSYSFQTSQNPINTHVSIKCISGTRPGRCVQFCDLQFMC